MIQEILDLGFKRVELGYDLTLDLVPGVRSMVENKSVKVDSVHNFCPVPIGAPYGHPELFHLSSTDDRQRQMAVKLTLASAEFAADIGGSVVVAHAGYVDLNNITRKLIILANKGKQFDPKYEKLKMKLLIARDKKVKKNIEALYKSCEELLPLLESHGITLALENLPSWEAVPCESEVEIMCKHFDSPCLRYWHDMGHAQTRQSLGFIGHQLWLDKLLPFTAGIHIHDVILPANDHLMPPEGSIDFQNFKKYFTDERLLVLEPAACTSAEKVLTGLKFMNDLCKD